MCRWEREIASSGRGRCYWGQRISRERATDIVASSLYTPQKFEGLGELQAGPVHLGQYCLRSTHGEVQIVLQYSPTHQRPEPGSIMRVDQYDVLSLGKAG